MTQNNVWYTVEDPRDLPCWKVNTKLWAIYNKLRAERGLIQLSNSDHISEQEVVQTIDLVLLKEGQPEYGI